jgi:hypothetical protein
MVTPMDAQSALEYIHNHTHETGHIFQDGNSYSLNGIKRYDDDDNDDNHTTIIICKLKIQNYSLHFLHGPPPLPSGIH